MNKLLGVYALALCMLPPAAGCKVWKGSEFPMIHLQDGRRYVCDPGNVLSPAARDSADALLRCLEAEKGVQTVVAVADSVENGDCYEFGMGIARANGVGDGKLNTGLVIVVSPGSRCYYILTGHGLEGSLPDAVCRRIEDRYMLPRLREGDWDGAVSGGVGAVCAYLQNDSSLLPGGKGRRGEGGAPLVALVITAALAAGLYAAYRSSQRRASLCPRCKKHAMRPTGETLQRTADGAKTEIYRCGNCGYSEPRGRNGGGGIRNAGAFLPPFIWFGGRGGMFRGGGMSGGSFGGGSFGGGGAGGRF